MLQQPYPLYYLPACTANITACCKESCFAQITFPSCWFCSTSSLKYSSTATSWTTLKSDWNLDHICSSPLVRYLCGGSSTATDALIPAPTDNRAVLAFRQLCSQVLAYWGLIWASNLWQFIHASYPLLSEVADKCHLYYSEINSVVQMFLFLQSVTFFETHV